MEYLSAIFWSDDKDEEDYCLLKKVTIERAWSGSFWLHSQKMSKNEVIFFILNDRFKVCDVTAQNKSIN